MKLNKLTSAVSVSLLAVALTACGSDDDAPIINNNTATTPAPAPAPAPTPAAVDNSANIAALTEAFKQARVPADKAAALAAANPTMRVGSTEFNALAAANAAADTGAGTGTNNAVSEVVKTNNHFIKNVDTENNATVTSNQYSRREGSNFDRKANRTQVGGLGAVGTDDPTEQNPFLSNYVLAVEATDNDVVVAIDSTGEFVKKVDGADNGEIVAPEESPYIKNGGLKFVSNHRTKSGVVYHYGDKSALPQDTNTKGEDVAGTNLLDLEKAKIEDGITAITNTAFDTNNVGTKSASVTLGSIQTLQQVNHTNVYQDLKTDAVTALEYANGTTKSTMARTNGKVSGEKGLGSGLVVYTAKSLPVGNAKGAEANIKVPVYGVEENIYQNGEVINSVEGRPSASKDNTAPGLVNLVSGTTGGIFKGALKDTAAEARQDVVDNLAAGTPYGGGDKAQRNPSFLSREVIMTRGETDPDKDFEYTEGYANTDQIIVVKDPAGSGKYVGVVDWDGYNSSVNVANNHETRIFGKNFIGYEAGKTGSQTTANTYKGAYGSDNVLVTDGVVADTLQHVQYGRLTNNIDVLKEKNDKSPQIYAYRQFQEHGAPNSVDTYFYRGTHHTTLDQMKAVIAKGGEVEYYGHALTYGIGPKVEATKAGTVPTSYGLASSEATIGNFVYAKYDTAKATVTGDIYNFINKDVANKPNDFVKQQLVTFTGDVFGNTVVGKATKLSGNEEGSLTASFFGSQANELGGSISSITREQGYAQPKWGAVFGAKAEIASDSGLSNWNVIERQNGGN